MNVDDMILVSIDDHLVEPPDIFQAHVPQKYRDQAPHLVRDEHGMDQWVFGEQVMGMVGLNAVVSWPKEQWGMNPSSIAEMRPGAYDIHERIRDMNRNGILASMCFPSMAGFSGRTFQEASDKDLSLVMLKAYNDWHIDEWCAAYPGRFIPRHPAALGHGRHHRGATPGGRQGCARRQHARAPAHPGIPELPLRLVGPVLHRHIRPRSRHEPAHRAGPQCHQPPGHQLRRVHGALAPRSPLLAVQDLLWGHALRQFPKLKIAFSEGGIGWLPFLMDRIDRHYQNQRWTGQDFGSKLPSELFREHSLACFIADPTSLKLYKEIGIDMIAFEADYPHSDCLWPDAPEDLLAQCVGAGCSDEDIDKISWKNVARFCNWDPFAAIPRTGDGRRAASRSLPTSTPAWSRGGVARPLRGPSTLRGGDGLSRSRHRSLPHYRRSLGHEELVTDPRIDRRPPFNEARSNSPMPKSRRPGTLTLDAIVEESVRIVRAQGVSGLTMRSVATGLGVTPMAIYYYVTDKEDLVRLVVGRISDSFGLFRVDPDRTWQETLREYMVNVWGNFRRYPGLSSYLIDQPALGVTPDRLEAGITFFEAAGFPPTEAAPGLVIRDDLRPWSHQRRRPPRAQRRRSAHRRAQSPRLRRIRRAGGRRRARGGLGRSSPDRSHAVHEERGGGDGAAVGSGARSVR